MLQIGDVLVSLDVIEKKFLCDISSCRGACCVVGESGAPLEDWESEELKNNYQEVKTYLPEPGVLAVEKKGVALIDSDGDLVTPLVENKECAFTVFEGEAAFCGIEKAYLDKKISFRKPISCQLYPIRTKKYEDFEAMNYDVWDLCKAARALGEKEGIPVYVFLKEALIRKYGESWYKELEETAESYLKQKKNV